MILILCSTLIIGTTYYFFKSNTRIIQNYIHWHYCPFTFLSLFLFKKKGMYHSLFKYIFFSLYHYFFSNSYNTLFCLLSSIWFLLQSLCFFSESFSLRHYFFAMWLSNSNRVQNKNWKASHRKKTNYKENLFQ